MEIELAKKIKQTSNGKQLKILNIGSGPGKDVMDVVSRFISKNSSLKIKATMVDNDPFAIEKGKKYAHDLGLKKNIEFVEGSLKKFSRDNYDICLVIGVLCPFRAPTCISILTELKERLKSGGTMIASNISKKVCETEEGQFTRFIMEYICDWYLAFKNKNELKKIFESSGYANVMIDAEAIGYHLLGKGIN